MPVKISDLTLPKDKLEKEYQVVSVSRWQREGEILGWSYECVLPKLRFEKISVKVASESPIVTKKELDEQGIALVMFTNLVVSPWGRANGQFVTCGLSGTADSASLVNKKPATNSNQQTSS